MTRHALLTGGTGAVGREILALLTARAVATTFTCHSHTDSAEQLASTHGARAIALDLRDPDAIKRALGALDDPPDLFIHAAATIDTTPALELTPASFHEQLTVNTASVLSVVQALAPSMIEAGSGDIVVLGALDRGQSLPIPAGFAASQGALSALVMALARELGPQGLRINMVSSGLLDAGLSQALPDSIFDDYTTFSAMRRLGTPIEVARAAVWLGLENTYMSGKIMPINGGI